jgi:hypothetical protein
LAVSKTPRKKLYIYPAGPGAQYPGNSDHPNAPMFGQRLRLKANVDISKLPKHAKAIALGLKKYGLIMMDNGRNWDFGVGSDPRIQDLNALKALHGSDFEVVISTGEFDPPRPPPPPPPPPLPPPQPKK